VDDEGTPLAARPEAVLNLVEHGRRLALAFQRHREQSRRLVHDNQLVVFVHHVQIACRPGPRPPLRAAGAIDPHADDVAGGEAS
jgi:hypothetical protein